MSTHDWHLTQDLDDFLSRAGSFLRSQPALHTVPLTVTEALRTRGPGVYGDGPPEFGVLERDGAVRASFFRTPPHWLNLTALTPEEADTLAARLAALGQRLPGVNADRDTAVAFTEAWQRHTGATATLRQRQRLYRLGTLTVPDPVPSGAPRVAIEADRAHLIRWHQEFNEALGMGTVRDDGGWADARIEQGGITFWETPDGTPVAMAGRTPLIAGQTRVAPVYTPSHLRGRGYAGAATSEVSRAALASGAQEVLLFTDLANPTSNGLYQRIGYRAVADFEVYDFG
ncbi:MULTISPECIES: GNAT family N-acetyltransferase [Streptomyces]|uniref:GNAT family N-acetyltransferase n=1 Tax=Streptomyces koelreuteriae TaxID=2838015 RepID=A0ABX8FUR4_9ACTN|nr:MULTISPECIES: GNAT family N-acetyltransferase [Streptomyces]QWB24943.1 GNAT family N-acetyltransferase [Streptomyces koelreuteriae]UUA07964.1 GNAT family N-acetyltransferase [Streptomyces koelreuteriae]UUA15592.1 GNAT family N-acetyltransferase [Streptomyces sp. CRCS-T-1]